jgi:hypothetical protein
MISPEMPTGVAIGQAIIDNEPNCKGDNGIRVIGLGRSKVGHVDGKIGFTFTTVVKGVMQDDVNGTTGKGIAEVM